MVKTEAVQIASAIEPEDGWPEIEAEAAVECAVDEMLDAGMNPARIQELIGDILRATMGDLS